MAASSKASAYKISDHAALIVVDAQNDFCPGGALPVPKGDEVVPVLNRYIEIFQSVKSAVVATRDWHPDHHVSFNSRGGAWPVHCVQGTRGADFHPGLKLPENSLIISKGSEPDREAYSGFQGTRLNQWLKEKKVDTVFIGGLATDYCVKSTVLDALKAGFKAVYLSDASRGVNVKPDDSERAEAEMRKAGAGKGTLKDFQA